MNPKVSRFILLFVVVCCLVLIVIPSIPANGQGRREINGTGVGSDILVPGEPVEEPRIIIVPAPVVAEPEPPPPPAPEARIEPQPMPEPAPEPTPSVEIPPYQPEPVATNLPKTAGELPALTLLGLLAIAGAGALRLVSVKTR